uniref:Uncharacterized protein n=1 Tax=Spironucleus salmonicida TaxID=348837 RepID=V6LTB8_9EUKA|eukprot:EST47892.1 Hypothetical protein SS50377_11994 [Spironucleus salmonicida]
MNRGSSWPKTSRSQRSGTASASWCKILTLALSRPLGTRLPSNCTCGQAVIWRTSRPKSREFALNSVEILRFSRRTTTKSARSSLPSKWRKAKRMGCCCRASVPHQMKFFTRAERKQAFCSRNWHTRSTLLSGAIFTTRTRSRSGWSQTALRECATLLSGLFCC